MKKKDARIIAKHYMSQIDTTSHAVKSRIIVSKLMEHEKFKQAKVIGIYYPIKQEVNITSLDLSDKVVCFPKINSDNELDFIVVNDKTKWEINKFGIKEPKSGKILNNKIDLLVIPALGTNGNNYRLGYGKGYYDKFLSKYHPLYTIGLVLDNFKLDFIVDRWDIKLNEFISN